MLLCSQTQNKFPSGSAPLNSYFLSIRDPRLTQTCQLVDFG